MPLESLKLSDFSDPELLGVLKDVSDDDGWATTTELARQLGFVNDLTGIRSVGTRFAWMKRWEWVERHPDTGKWRVTAIGLALMGGSLNKSTQAALDKLKPADRVKAIRTLAEQANVASLPQRQMFKREWRRNVEKVAS